MIFKLNYSTQPSSEVKKVWILTPRLPHTIMQTLLVAWQWEEEFCWAKCWSRLCKYN